MVIPRFVKQALSGESITVYGDGSQRRTFCSVSDVVTAIFELIQNESSHGEVFNVGSTNSVTILELAQKIRAKVGSDSPIVFVNANEKLGLGFEEIDNRCPDIEKITSLVGWTPKKSLDDIIKEVILYTQKN
jgi:UDP-glucose 4-epimerase